MCPVGAARRDKVITGQVALAPELRAKMRRHELPLSLLPFVSVRHSMNTATSPLLTDLYAFNMLQAYLEHGDTKTAVFEFFVRKLPARRGFLMAAGLQPALDFLENLRFSTEEIEQLAGSARFSQELLDYLARFRFSGDVHAMPEG